MEFILANVTKHAMNYAIRSGITITSGYALSQCSRLMKTQNGKEHEELARLQRRLDSKIRIISPAIDMIELITARGNTSLESCLALTKALRLDIQNLGSRLANAAADEEDSKSKGSKSKSKQQRDQELRFVIADMRTLLERIEDAVPLISLAITTSGVSLSTALPASISPSRLLQASTFLSAGDVRYLSDTSTTSQIGPTFTLSLYMLFSGHTHNIQNEENLRQATWQEVIHKARVKLIRTRISALGRFQSGRFVNGDSIDELPDMPAGVSGDEFAYQLTLVEDMDDGRHHGDVEGEQFDGIAEAGIREVIPVHEISKIFYADTGKILNIGSSGETNNPILLLKRDLNAVAPRRMVERDWAADECEEEEGEEDDDDDDQEQKTVNVGNTTLSVSEPSNPWRLSPGLDPDWLAFEVFSDDPDSDSESEASLEDSEYPSSPPVKEQSARPSISSRMASLRLSSSPVSKPSSPKSSGSKAYKEDHTSSPLASLPYAARNVRTSLSLLEMLIRLTSLQQFQQASHLTINDELLNFFLEESSTTGAPSGDTEERKRIRMEARRRVGFDPYDESPVKRHGEDYQRQEPGWDGGREEPAKWSDGTLQFSRDTTPMRSPELLRSKEHSSRAGTPDRTRISLSSSPAGAVMTPADRQSRGSAASPQGTTNTKSREAFLRDEAARDSRGRGSPLSKSVEGSG